VGESGVTSSLFHLNWLTSGSAGNIQGSIFAEGPGIRFPDQNRSAIFPERFSIAIVIAIAGSKSLTDFKM